jgi:integrase
LDVSSQVLKDSKPIHNLTHDVVTNLNPSLKEPVDDVPFLRREDVRSHNRTITGQKLNTYRNYNSTRRVCVSEGEAKNLAKVEPPNNRPAGATEQTIIDSKEKIFQFKWWLKKQGYAESTIKSRARLLNVMVKRGANLDDPDSIKEVIAKQNWCPGRKENAVNAYTSFLQMYGAIWDPPRYRRLETIPFVPTENEIDQLISGCSRKISVFLQLLKETGIRRGEAWQVQWMDLDFQTQTIRITPEKRSKPRIFNLSNKLIAMLNNLPRNTENIFGDGAVSDLQRTFQRQRQRLAHKFGNPRIKRITFHTFRHWKATMLYHQTKDILYVMQFLGHRNIKNTLVYIQLEEALFKHETEDYVCKVASTVEEAKALIEVGYEYICDFESHKMFRKRQ